MTTRLKLRLPALLTTKMPHQSPTSRVMKVAVVCAIATLASSAITFAASAQAATYHVVGTGGTLHVRSAPSLSAPLVENLTDGTAIDIVCQTTGDTVVRSAVWDKIDHPTAGYVADWYTTTPAVGAFTPGIPVCGNSSARPTPTPTPAPPRSPSPAPSPSPSPPSSPAPTGGQQIALSALADLSFRICGANQYGHATCLTRDVSFPPTPVKTPAILVNSYWWSGNVVIQNYAQPGERDLLGTTTCHVPALQTGSDWTTCVGTQPHGYPYTQSFAKVGGKSYTVLSAYWAYDPAFKFYVPRDYTFGYWDGHYVYKITDHVGVDIQTGAFVIAETTNHWIVFAGAVTAAGTCAGDVPEDLPPDGRAAAVVVASWCGVVGAVGAFVSPAVAQTPVTPPPTPSPTPTPPPTPGPGPAVPTAPALDAVTFTGDPSNPTVTIDGLGFGVAPTATNLAYPGYTGYDYGTALYVCDTSPDPTVFCAGHNDGAGGVDLIGLVVTNYTDAAITSSFGSTYTQSYYPSNTYRLQQGDRFTVDVNGLTCSVTVAFGGQPVPCS